MNSLEGLDLETIFYQPQTRVGQVIIYIYRYIYHTRFATLASTLADPFEKKPLKGPRSRYRGPYTTQTLRSP